MKRADVWVGRLPAGWEKARLKNSVASIQVGTWGGEPQGDETDVRCVRVADFDRPRLGISDEDVTLRSVPPRDQARLMLRKGDLLIEKSGGTGRNPVGFVTLYDSEEAAVCSNFIGRMRLRSGQVPRFWLYAHAASYDHRITQRSLNQTTGIQNLDLGAYLDEEFPFPPQTEQQAIADFLDRETSHIDAMIESQRGLVQQLEERRSAAVDRLVTGRDIDALRVCAPSTWLPDIPVHWEVKPLWVMYERKKVTGLVDLPMVSVFREYGVVFKDDHDNLNVTAEDRSIYQLVEPGWLVVNRMKAWQGSVGVSAIRGISSGHYLCFRPLHGERHEYLNHLFRSPTYRRGLASESRGVRIGQAEVDNDRLRLFPVLVPPLEEQRQIAHTVSETTKSTNDLIAAANDSMALMQERRSALITAAVTGRISPHTGRETTHNPQEQ